MCASEPDPKAPVGEADAGTGHPREDARGFPCAKCGAKLLFVPGATVLRCPYCNHENPIEAELNQVAEEDFEAALATLERAEPHEQTATVTCSACAAILTPAPGLTSFPCPFCNTSIVADSRWCSLVRPKGVLPFKITTEQSRDAFRKWIKSLWFAPNALKKRALIESAIRGIYIPAWTYDTQVTTHYTGQRGEHYYVTVGSGNNRRTERRTRWYPASGVVHNGFDDVLVPATRSLPDKLLHQLEPWDTKAVVPYQDDYLAGFTAERYVIDLKQGFEIAKNIMQAEIDSTIRRDIGGDEQRITSKRSTYRNIRFKHLLLPVWVSAYRYRDKLFQFLVNARTGEVQGERPWSAWKIAFAILGGLVIIGGIIYFVVSNN